MTMKRDDLDVVLPAPFFCVRGILDRTTMLKLQGRVLRQRGTERVGSKASREVLRQLESVK